MDASEVERWIEDNHERCFAWSLACCGRDWDAAGDVVQAAYVKILTGKAQYGARSSLRTWVFGVIRRTALERHRWKRTRERIVTIIAPQTPAQADDVLERSETTAALLRSLTRLATRQREVIELVFYHDMSLEESASVLGISVGSARVHYHRAKKRLLALIREEAGIAACT